MRHLILVLILGSLALAQTSLMPLDGATVTIEREGKTERYRLLAQTVTPSTQPAPALQPAQAPPGRSFAIDLSDAVAPVGVSVHALDLGAELLTTQFEWDFGDPKSARNALRGFVAGHVYDRPGSYVIKLTVTQPKQPPVEYKQTIDIYPDARRVVEVSSTELNALVRACENASDDVRILLQRGGVYDVDRTFLRPGKRVLIGATGDAKLPKPVVRYTGVKSGEALISCSGMTVGLVVENITFDSIAGAKPDTTALATAIVASGKQIVVRGCTFLNLSMAINGNGKPAGIVVQDCDSPNIDGLRRYFTWIEGTDWTILDNRVANSTREHCVRGAHFERVLVAYNDLTNVARQDVDPVDIAKTTLNLQKGEYAYVYENTLRGPSSLGPLGKSDGMEYKDHRSRCYVVESNHFERSALELQHGLSDVMLRGNTFDVTDSRCISIDGYDSTYGRGVGNVTITQNTGTNKGTAGGFLMVGGAVDGIVLTGNRYDSPNLRPGSRQTANVYVNDKDLSSFRAISGNTWSAGKPQNFAQGGVMYVWPKWSDAQGYLDPKEWDANAVVKNDKFK